MSLFNSSEYGNASIDNQNAVSFSFFLFLKKSFNLSGRPAKVSFKVLPFAISNHSNEQTN